MAGLLLSRSKTGARLFRNNTGTAYQGQRVRTQNGFIITNPRPVHFGLCKGSSDLIGWTPHVITEADLGKTVAIFTAIEVKTKGVKVTPEQRNFIARVNEAGGIGEFIYE